ncbi:MAG TPA: hypothetical protein VGS57_00460 [Thermoanaerobaculia bacterium]|jgi:hypothetical protein|nr:hypothetical protein [Thermoanaerobaculia bacterium]
MAGLRAKAATNGPWPAAAGVVTLGVVCVLGAAGCASAPAKAPRSVEQTAATAPQTVTPPPSPPPSHVEDPVAATVRGNEPVVIDEGTANPSGAQELAAAAAAERERRRNAGPATMVINNANLAQHATGKLTIVSGAEPARAGAAAPANDTAKDERYWRDRVRGLREQWAAAVDAIGELEARAASLRTRFYAQDDPYVRDGEIKPAWDRALENLEESRRKARSLEDQLGAVLEEGRQAGALPGWLRDGIELEPSERPYDKPDHEVARDDGNLVREPEELGQPPH